MEGDEYGRLLERALREDWPLTPDLRRLALRRMLNLLDDEHEEGAGVKPRTRISAFKAILAAQALDLQRLKIAMQYAKDKDSEGLESLVEEAERIAGEYTPDEPPAAGGG